MMRFRVALLLVVGTAGFSAAVAIAPHKAEAQATRGATDTTATTATTPTTTTPTSGRSTASEFQKAFWKIVLLSALVLGVWAIPLTIDLVKAYRYQERLLTLFDRLIHETKADGKPLDTKDLETLIATKFVPTSPSGVTGLGRSLMALLIGTSIAIALIVFLAVGSSDDRTLVRTIVTTLLAALTTIVGFYFGARTAEGAHAAGVESAVTVATETRVAEQTPRGGGGGDAERAAGQGQTSTQ